MLLFHVGELGIAEGVYAGTREQRLHQAFIARQEFGFALRPLAIAPSAGVVAPADAAEFAYEHGVAVRVELGGEFFGILLIVVAIGQLAQAVHMRPAGGIQHRPRGIESAGEVYQEAHEFAVLILLGFVERAPADQRGVVAIALEFFQPFGQEIAPRFRARDVQPPVGLFTPYEVAQPVAMVEEALFKDLFVQARAVEAHVHGKADITL